MPSKAATVDQFLAELPPDRREAIQAVRETILANLDSDYREGIAYGMIGYVVPHEVFPAGYHCKPEQPLPLACLASQKGYMTLHMMSLYIGGDGREEPELARWFRQAWAKTGKKLDMGKACIRFKKVDDLALDVIGEAFRRMPAKKYVEVYTSVLDSRDRKGAAKPVANKGAKSAAKAPAKKSTASAKRK
jgi:hypothetical protein